MKKKTYGNGESVLTDSGVFEFSEPYTDYFDPFDKSYGGEIKCHVEINLDGLIDRYDYHDAPSSVEVWAEKKDLIDLRNILNLAIKKMDAVENG